MKLIIRDYLASLRERDELDAVLPDLLSELGFTVLSRPGRGTTQYGVDVAAVGADEDGSRKLFLFSIKQGDLTREEWDAPLQGLRSSLNEIRDAYLKSRVPKRYAALPVVICMCFGGDVREQVQSMVSGYIDENSTDRISYDIWNGDRLAGLIEAGLLREKLLPSALQSSLRKAVALVDEPDVSFHHFSRLTRQISESPKKGKGARVRAARQLYVCLWMLFVWSRDADNVEAAYLASELSMLRIWEFSREVLPQKNAESRALEHVLSQTIKLHLIISSEFLDKKIYPTISTLHATSMAINTRSAVDVNLKLFDLLGRIAMSGLWVGWTIRRIGRDAKPAMKTILGKAIELIQNNPALAHPLRDDHAIDMNLILLLSLQCGELQSEVGEWFARTIDNIDFSYRGERIYPCVFGDYGDLLSHPKKGDSEYFREATSGSILIPMLAAWATGVGHTPALQTLIKLKAEVLQHCTLQAWLPGDDTENGIYIGNTDHGFCLADLPVEGDGSALIDALQEACKRDETLASLSAVKLDVWPLVLVACRHHRLPVPPQFWIGAFVLTEGELLARD